MSKDQTISTVIIAVCVILALAFIARAPKWSVRSLCVFPYDDYYSESGMDEKLDEINSRLPEVNYIEIRTYWQPDPKDRNNVIYTGGAEGYLGTQINSLSELEVAVNKIHARKMEVILWSAMLWEDSGPNATDWSLWLENYGKYAATIADWAQNLSIPIYVFGCEMDNIIPNYALLGSNYTGQWNQTITRLRTVYTGSIGFGFNWWYTPTHWNVIYNQSTWVAKLDFIQVDSYVSLGKNCFDGINATEIAEWWNPTIENLEGNWTDSRFGPHWNYVKMYEDLSDKYNKKILINIGYRNNNGTNTQPWANPYLHDLYGNTVPGWGTDVKEMNDCWEAFFRTWSNSSAIMGVDIESYTQANTNCLDGSIRNKYDNATDTYTWQVIHQYLSAVGS